MTAVTSEMLQAAWEADYAWWKSPDRERGGSWGSVHEAQLRRLLEAAAPLIAAAERERIIRLATQLRAAIPADHPEGAHASFADYLRQQPEGDST